MAISTTAPNLTIIPDAAVMRLDDLGLYRVGYAYRGKPEQNYPDGWSGDFDPLTGVACRPNGTQNGKQTFLLHCPWRGGTGIAFQEFTFQLPRVRFIQLQGATALRTDAVGNSDGVTFRIFVNGRKALDRNQTDSAWRPFRLDLSPEAGQKVTVRFETDPGPRDNPSFDFALWGDRSLVLEGYHPPAPPVHPAPLPIDLRRLWSSQNGSTAPMSAFPEMHTVEIHSNEAILRCAGADGSLTYHWLPPGAGATGLFGRLVLDAQLRGDRPVRLPFAGNAAVEWTGPAQDRGDHFETPSPGVVTLVRKFEVAGKPATFRIAAHLEGKSLVLRVTCDRPVIHRLDGGRWGPALRRVPLPVPYYSGQVYWLPHEDLFVNAYPDWIESSGSLVNGSAVSYEPLTDGSRRLLRETFIYTASWHVEEALPNIPNPPSPYRSAIAGSVVLDIWGGRFTDIARSLRNLAGYGIGDVTVLEHDWQWAGYDNGLPQHLPAQAALGGDAGMKELVSTGLRLGYRMALHENYIDYYPNYPHFNPKDIALGSDGKREMAWFNSGTHIQSFAEKPTAIVRLASTQSPLIHRQFGANADFIDVLSSVEPWFHTDFQWGEPQAGMFHGPWRAHRDLWAFERQTYQGPVFGEGNHHWYWSGLLDGVEAQFGSGWPSNQGLTAPLAVDFDLIRIHPLQFNHGMGYYERWWDRPTWGMLPPMRVLDQYRMQEVAYGHAGFLSGSTWSSIPYAWIETHLLQPVMQRYAVSRPVSIRYQVGGVWVDGTAAAKQQAWRRVRVRYENGLTITANDDPTPLRIGALDLPRFGWVARGAGVTAWTARKQGVMADYAETSRSVFVNARSETDWSVASVHRIRPTVASFLQTGTREFRVTYSWRVGEPISPDLRVFVHFLPAGGDETILFQNDHTVPVASGSPHGGQTVSDGPYTVHVPETLPDGSYRWVIGLYSPNGGSRLPLEGFEVGQNRILLGTLRVSDGGKSMQFISERRSGDDRLSIYSEDLNMNAAVVDFGHVRTDGSVYLEQTGRLWTLRVFPRNRRFKVQLDAARFGRPSLVRCAGGSAPIVTPQGTGRFWTLPLTGASVYEWTAGTRPRSPAAVVSSGPR